MKNYMRVVLNETETTITELLIKPSDILLSDEIKKIWKDRKGLIMIWNTEFNITKCKRDLGIFDKKINYEISNSPIEFNDKFYYTINEYIEGKGKYNHWMVEKDLLQHLFYSKNELRKEKITKLLNEKN
jgi:hypothetical protein